MNCIKIKKSREFSRSLFVVKDIKAGEIFIKENTRSIRSGYGFLPKYLEGTLAKNKIDIKKLLNLYNVFNHLDKNTEIIKMYKNYVYLDLNEKTKEEIDKYYEGNLDR